MANENDIMKITALAGGAVLLKSAISYLLEYDLRNKTVLITGGSRGLGLVMAREFARRVRVSRFVRATMRNSNEPGSISDRFGVEVMAFRCDVRIKQEVNDMVAAVSNRFGHIDVLVNNAGVIQVGPLKS